MFEVSLGVGTDARNLDGEIAAVQLTKEEIANYHPATATKHAVFFIDFKAAITAIADYSNLFHSWEAIAHLTSKPCQQSRQ